MSIALASMLGTAWHAIAQDAKASYPSIAPVDLYLIEDRSSEIALARSAVPESISRDAEALVLGRHGYETAINGTNGFVCMVERSWTAPIDDPDFWNPKLRAPICFNAAAASSYLPRTIKKTGLILAGRTTVDEKPPSRALEELHRVAAPWTERRLLGQVAFPSCRGWTFLRASGAAKTRERASIGL